MGFDRLIGISMPVSHSECAPHNLLGRQFHLSIFPISLDDELLAGRSCLCQTESIVSKNSNYHGDNTMANIIGTNQDDNLIGTNENDIITSKLGNDFVDGGAGIDTLVLDFSSLDSVSGNFDAASSGSGSYNGSGSGGKFSNISFTSIERLNIQGSKGNDFFTGGVLNDVLRGGIGNDVLYGEAGNDIIDGGTGNDFLDGGSGNDLILGGAGNDLISSGGGADIINGGDGNDALLDADFSNSTQNLVFRDSGKTYGRLTFANGTIATNIEFLDGITTGSGNDRILYSLNRDNTINTGDGNDTINAGLGRDVVDGGAGDDLLIIDYSSTGGVSSFVFGNSGFYVGFEVNSPIGLGNLSFTNIERLDVTGSSGNDLINGLSGNDILRGGAGNDRILGNGGADFLYGGTGDDQLFNNGGAAFIDGGAGIDGIEGDFSSATTDLVFTDATFLSGTITLSNGAVAVNVELFDNLTTGSGNDQISFSRNRNNLINTGDGNDTINTGLGYDFVDGGAGDDLLIIDYSIAGLVYSSVSGDSGFYSSFDLMSPGGPGTINFSGIERLDVTGSVGNDRLYGTFGNDVFKAGLGSDYISAASGDDFIQLGNDGFSDTIVYSDGDGADTIVGFEQGSTGDQLFIDNIAAVDVVTTHNSSGWKTQVYLGDGISGNAGFGSGSLIATLTNIQLTTADVGINLRSSSGAQFLFA
jgi:Ca2+-binding RTX toxin-like protein